MAELVVLTGFEPVTLRLGNVDSYPLSYKTKSGGAGENRTLAVLLKR